MKNTSKTIKSIAASALAISVGLVSQAAWADTTSVEIRNFIGTVEIKTGDYDRVRVVTKDGADIDKTDHGVVIDAGQSVSRIRCRTKGDTVKITVGKSKWFGGSSNWTKIDEYPNMVIHAPVNTHIDIDKSLIFATIGDVGSAQIHMQSCGDLVLGNVAGNIDLEVSGSADVEMGSAGNAELSISGAGDMKGKAVKNLTAHVSGSGDLTLSDIDGFADISASGSGDVTVGSIADGLKYKGSGSCDLEAKAVRSGNIDIRQSGAGDVKINAGNIEDFDVRVSGASDVHYGGTVQNSDVNISGASNVSMRKPTGQHEQSISGAGSIHFDH